MTMMECCRRLTSHIFFCAGAEAASVIASCSARTSGELRSRFSVHFGRQVRCGILNDLIQPKSVRFVGMTVSPLHLTVYRHKSAERSSWQGGVATV